MSVIKYAFPPSVTVSVVRRPLQAGTGVPDRELQPSSLLPNALIPVPAVSVPDQRVVRASAVAGANSESVPASSARTERRRARRRARPVRASGLRGEPSRESRPPGDAVVAAGRWPLAAGRWPLAAGRWPLAAGRWPLAAGRWPLAAGRWPLAAGRWPLAAGNYIQRYTRPQRRSTTSLPTPATSLSALQKPSGRRPDIFPIRFPDRLCADRRNSRPTAADGAILDRVAAELQ